MRSLRELGIGLSVVFGIFFLALLAELCYIFLWKKRGSTKSISADCLKSATEIKAGNKRHHRSSAEFVREASLVGSFGGYPAEARVGSDYAFSGNSCDQAPHLLLFPIKEETKEDMELAAGSGGTTKPNSRLRSRTPSDVLTIHFTSGSSSPAGSVGTPFTTPPSSPPPPPPIAKLSPYAACAVRPMSRASSPLSGEIYVFNGAAGRPLSPAANGRAALRVLFERSPLLGPGNHMPLPFRPTSSAAKESSNASPPNSFYRRLSLAALFRQSSTTCLPLSTAPSDANNQNDTTRSNS